VVRICIYFRAASGSKWPTKLIAILLSLLALAAMFFIVLGVWLVLSVIVVLIAVTIIGGVLLNRNGEIIRILPSARKDVTVQAAGRTLATRASALGKYPPSDSQ
jgi:uncharacterized membrane protein